MVAYDCLQAVTRDLGSNSPPGSRHTSRDVGIYLLCVNLFSMAVNMNILAR
jgi:hypothetical protein